EIVALEIVLRGEIIRLGLAAPADQFRVLLSLMHVMRNRPKVVEKFAEHVPATLLAHDVRSEEFVADDFDSLFQQDPLAGSEVDVAEPLVLRRPRAIGGIGSGREPALIDTAPMRAESVQIAGIELQAATRHEEGARHPAWRKSYNALASAESFF